MDWETFFIVHRGLPREGPGSPEDVDWAMEVGGIAKDAVICDAGSGPGSDVAALLAHVPQGRVVAVDKVEAFVRATAERFGAEPRLRAVVGDLTELATLPEAPFDGIWCAGALYFLGLDTGPSVMAQALKPGGILAFSEPAFLCDNPSEAARALWEGYPAQDAIAIARAVEAQGYEVLGQRTVGDVGWEAYYQPLEARIASLRTGADPRLTAMLDLCADEAARWRAVKHETGYVLTVARTRA